MAASRTSTLWWTCPGTSKATRSALSAMPRRGRCRLSSATSAMNSSITSTTAAAWSAPAPNAGLRSYREYSASMAETLVNIEIDGKLVKAHKGEMIIRAADREGIYIPRFCYHEKLSVAANCRMCLVEVEKVPKPLVACATPVAEGMKVFTRSMRALQHKRGTFFYDAPLCAFTTSRFSYTLNFVPTFPV